MSKLNNKICGKYTVYTSIIALIIITIVSGILSYIYSNAVYKKNYIEPPSFLLMLALCIGFSMIIILLYQISQRGQKDE